MEHVLDLDIVSLVNQYFAFYNILLKLCNILRSISLSSEEKNGAIFLLTCYYIPNVKSCSNYRAVVISEGQPPEVLTQLNSVIRRIDLTCKLGAPVVTGFIITFVSLKASALTLSLWNILSVFLQYWLLMSVYNGIPSLGERNQKRAALRLSPVPEESPSTSQEQTSLLPLDANYSESSNSSWTRKIIERFSKSPYIIAWRVYLQQDVVLPGVSLALLYFTILRLTSYGIDSLEIVAHIVYYIGFGNNLKMERLPDFPP